MFSNGHAKTCSYVFLYLLVNYFCVAETVLRVLQSRLLRVDIRCRSLSAFAPTEPLAQGLMGDPEESGRLGDVSPAPGQGLFCEEDPRLLQSGEDVPELQVGIEYRDDVPAALPQAGEDRSGLALVPLVPADLEERVLGGFSFG